jgi:hypothetical protein
MDLYTPSSSPIHSSSSSSHSNEIIGHCSEFDCATLFESGYGGGGVPGGDLSTLLERFLDSFFDFYLRLKKTKF